MVEEYDGALVSLMDPFLCQDVMSLLARAGNAYNSLVGTPFKPMRAAELRKEQYSKFYQKVSLSFRVVPVLAIASALDIRHHSRSLSLFSSQSHSL